MIASASLKRVALSYRTGGLNQIPRRDCLGLIEARSW